MPLFACPTCGLPGPERTCPEHRPNRRRWERQSRGSTTYARVRRAVLERDAYTCVHCGAPAAEVDHLVPVAHGGGDEPENLVAACTRCNRSRGARVRSAPHP